MKQFYTILFIICAVSLNSQITDFPYVDSFSLNSAGDAIDSPNFGSYTNGGETGGFAAYGISGAANDYAFFTKYPANPQTNDDLVAYGYLGPFTVTAGVSDGFKIHHSTLSGGPQNFHFVVIDATDALSLAQDVSGTNYDYFTTTVTHPTYDSSAIDLTGYVGQTISVGIYVGAAPITVADYLFTDDWTIGSYATLSDTEFSSIVNTISIYPNPSTNYINFSGLDDFEISEVTIFNQIGQISKKIDFISNKSNSIDVSDLSAGLYFVEIKSLGNQIDILNFLKK